MSSVTYENGFPANHIVGGINMGFWPLGPLGRRVGVVWIRRSFGGNEVYKYALRRYLAHLASKRFNLEWYIEGGRSRTGKLLPPRMGLLNYLAKGVEEAGVEEVMLVPVSIVYDRLNELVETTSQARGAKKRPEGTRWLVALRAQPDAATSAACRSASASRCRCARRWPTATRTRSARSRSRSARGSTARRRSRRSRSPRWRCSARTGAR